MTMLFIKVILSLSLLPINVEIVTNGNGYYIENGSRAIIVETPLDDVEPLILLPISK